MKNMRSIYVVYDVQDDGLRNKLANILLFYGLHRVQYSVFCGLISMEDKKNLLREIRSLNIGENDKIHVFDLCNKCVKKAIIIGKFDGGKEHLIL